MKSKEKEYVNNKNAYQRKADQLGMSAGKARNILNNSILFDLVKECGDNICYRCGKSIDKVEDLTVDHKEPYLYSENSVDLFFNLDNIAFSHKVCNCKTSRNNSGLKTEEEKLLNKNKLKEKYIGMSYGKARNILFYDLLFTYVKKTGKDICFQCGEKILSKDDLSIEHKEPYLHSKNPKDLFFDLNNIAFSHRSCNYKANRGSEYRKHSVNSKPNKLGYKGIECRKNRPTKYAARITVNGKSIYLGSSNDIRELAELYDKKAIELLGEDAITNKKLGLL